jgi:glucokinase
MLAVGIDIGATKIATGLVDVGTGTVLSCSRRLTDKERGSESVLADCVAAARSEAGDFTDRVGISLCELVDPAGVPQSGHSVDLRTVDIERAFAPFTVTVESDVRAAARAEALFGSGRTFNSFVYVTIGSGIAACLVEDGSPRVGAHGNALILGAPPVELVASGLALAAIAGEKSAEEVLAEPRYATLVQGAAEQLGLAIAALVNALDPEAVVVGGGLGLEPTYRDKVVAAMRHAIYADNTRNLPVVPGGLGPVSAVVGAAIVAANAEPASVRLVVPS